MDDRDVVPPEVEALWGKDGGETDYRVLRCSKGPFGPDDFQEIITRYASGATESLPQYTVYWIPAEARGQAHREQPTTAWPCNGSVMRAVKSEANTN